MRREENQLDVTECFFALMIRSICYGHFYVHHQELKTICVLLPPMVCSACLLVVGGQVQDSRLWVQKEGCSTTRAASLFLDSDRPWGPPSVLYSGYRFFPGGKERPGRDADPSPLLVPWSWKGRAVPLLPLWAVRPVQSLSACTRETFTLHLCF